MRREGFRLELHPGTTWRCWLLGGGRCGPRPGPRHAGKADGVGDRRPTSLQTCGGLITQGPVIPLGGCGPILRDPSHACNVPSGRIAPASEATSLSCLAVTLAPVRSAPLRLAL